MTVTDTAPAVDAAEDVAVLGKPFNVLLMVEGLESSDGRMFELGTTSWRQLPIPFRVQDTTPHGPGQTPAPAWTGGQIDEWVARDENDPSRILGRGHLMPNELGARAEELARHGFRGVSVDAYGTDPLGTAMQPTHVDEQGDPLAVLLRYTDSCIARATMVPTPAIEGCCIWFDDEDMPDIARTAHGAVIPTDTEPEIISVNSNAFEQMVAAGGGPLNPPRTWFFTSEPDHYQPIEVTPDGRWAGHIAKSGQCFLGAINCKTAPMSSSVPPYKGFHRTVARCDDGTEVACGWVTIGAKHAPDLHELPAGQVADIYDHTGTLGAKIRCSNGRHGVWSSGAVLPGLAERDLAILQGPEVSGDWRHWTDPETGSSHPLELLGVLGVPFPAFPGTRTRPELLVASGGEIIGQRGQIIPCDDEGEPMTPDEQAAHEALVARVDSLAARMDVLIAAAGPEVAATIAETFAVGVTEGIADAAPAVDDAAAEIAAAIDTETEPEIAMVDLSAPLTPSELATYLARYDQHTRQIMAADERAMRDGSLAIGDVDDLFNAARLWKGDDRTRTHLERNAFALGRTDIHFDGEVAFAKYSADELRDLLAKGHAMPPAVKGGQPRYPIDDEDDLSKAIQAVGRGSGSHAEIRAFIARRAKDMGKTDAIPDSWDSKAA